MGKETSIQVREATTQLELARKLRRGATSDWGIRFWDREVERHEYELREALMMSQEAGAEATGATRRLLTDLLKPVVGVAAE